MTRTPGRFSVLLLIAAASPVSAGGIHEDRVADSASGKFRIEARSRDTAAGKREDQRNFEYSLIDTGTAKAAWSRMQEESEDVPTAVYVADDGTAVVRTESQEVIVLDHASGKTVNSFQVDGQFTVKERAEFTENNGRWWAGSSRSYFISVGKDGATAGYFVIRPYWGRRIVVDLASGAPLAADKVSTEIADAAQAAEEAWVRGIVGRFAKIAEKSKYPIQGMTEQGNRDAADLRTAIFLAGAMDLRSEIPKLKLLEKCRVSGSVGMGRSNISTSEDNVRQACQTALRRLGERPVQEAGIRISLRDDKPGDDLTSKAKVADRAAHVEDIKKGMSLKEVVTAIGLPDYRPEGSGEILDYDVDGDAPLTLRVHFDDDFAKVKWIERIDPPAWKKISRRDRGFDW